LIIEEGMFGIEEGKFGKGYLGGIGKLLYIPL
jgi:hypothetical protein